MTPLAADYVVGPLDVICAPGKRARHHSGNVKYRERIQQCLERYAGAKSKLAKSIIVTEVVDSVRSGSPEGGFVRKVDGVWYEVGDHIAREKVGQSFRDCLDGMYRSSNKAKAKRKRLEANTTGIVGDVDHLVQSNEFVSKRMSRLSSDVQQRGEDASEFFITQLFNQANIEILDEIKRDTSLRVQFTEAEASQKKTDESSL